MIAGLMMQYKRIIQLMMLGILLSGCGRLVAPEEKDPVKLPLYPNAIVIDDTDRAVNQDIIFFKTADEPNRVFEWYIRQMPADWILTDFRDTDDIFFIKKSDCYKFTITLQLVEIIQQTATFRLTSIVNDECR